MGLFVLNIAFSALGLLQFTGGEIIYNYASVNFPTITIVSGGRVGLIPGILGGIIATFIEGRFWNNTRGTRNVKSSIGRLGVLITLSVLFVIYDILTTYYFVNGAVWDRGFGDNAGSLLITLSLFSIGPEMFATFFFEMVAENWDEGAPVLGSGIAKVFRFFGGMIMRFINGGDDEKSDLPERKPISVYQQAGGEKRRGRPPREEQERVEF